MRSSTVFCWGFTWHTVSAFRLIPKIRASGSIVSRAVSISRASLEALTVPVLKERLRASKLPVSGTKAILIDRLVSATTNKEFSNEGLNATSKAFDGIDTALVVQSPLSAKLLTNKRTTIPRDATTRRLVQPGSETSMLRAISWNVNGLRALLRRPEQLVELLMQERPHVLFFQETKLQEAHVTEVQENLRQLLEPLGFDYETHFTSSTAKKGYSGVCLLIDRLRCPAGYKVTFGFDAKTIVAKEQVDSNDAADVALNEGRVLTVAWDGLALVGAYVPNSGEGLKRLAFRCDEWDPALAAHLNGAGSAVVACGDFNVAVHDEDFYNPTEKRMQSQSGTTPQERDSFRKHFLRSSKPGCFGFGIDSFRSIHGPDATGIYSYWSTRAKNRPHNRGLRLDYWLVSPHLEATIVDAFVCDHLHGSDHCPVGIDLDVTEIFPGRLLESQEGPEFEGE